MKEIIEIAADWFEKYLADGNTIDDWCRDSENVEGGREKFYREMGFKRNLDLFFAPEKKVGWMNLYKRDFGLVQGDLVRDSEEAAKKIAAGDEDYITTIKVEWED